MWILLILLVPRGDCPKLAHHHKLLAPIHRWQGLEQSIHHLDIQHVGGAFCQFLHNLLNDLDSIVVPLPIGWVRLDKLCQ